MKIGITISINSYTPEAYAYEKYLKNLGHQVELDYDLDPNNDINIFFMGTRPFWEKKEGRAIEIHEYQSLSTPPYAKLKDFAKKFVNKKPSGRIFLNNFVHQNLNFNDDSPYIYRDMGVDEALFQKPNQNPEYDILYCGSISGRIGLIDTLLNLAKNYKVIVVGKTTDDEALLLRVKNITLLGQVSRDQLPGIYRNSRFGLNYTPDIYPFNIQTSTKTLEYLASGLDVISNRYKWAEVFFRNIKYQPIWLDNLDLSFEREFFPEILHFKWSNILNEVNFNNFIEDVVSK